MSPVPQGDFKGGLSIELKSSMQQIGRYLGDNGETALQVVQANMSNINAINQDAATAGFVLHQSEHGSCQTRFPSPCSAQDAHLLLCLHLLNQTERQTNS